MKELKEINQIFNDCYKLYKRYASSDLTDEVAAQLAEEAERVSKKYNCRLATDILVAVVDEIDRIEREQHKGITPEKIIKAVHETQGA